jgi:hypothetical protein
MKQPDDQGADVGAEGLSLQTRGLSRQGARDVIAGHIPTHPVDRIRVVHESPSAGALGAMAFTRGADIRFSAGAHSDQRLLGHEMMHTIQQASGRDRTP